MPYYLLAFYLILSITVSGCSKKNALQKKEHQITRYQQQFDSPPAKKHIPNLNKIPKIQPKFEPKSKTGNPKSYKVFNKKYTVLKTAKGYKEKGLASWYGKKFHGHRTSSGESYDMYAMTAAHKTLPLPTYVKVKNLSNGKTLTVKINDRGPFHKGRIIDLSYAAAHQLGILEKGTATVEVTAIHLSPGKNYTKHSISSPSTQPYLQLGAFGDKNNALNLVTTIEKTLASLPFQFQFPITINESSQNSLPLYKVHIGPIISKKKLKKLSQFILSKNLPSPLLVSLPING